MICCRSFFRKKAHISSLFFALFLFFSESPDPIRHALAANRAARIWLKAGIPAVGHSQQRYWQAAVRCSILPVFGRHNFPSLSQHGYSRPCLRCPHSKRDEFRLYQPSLVVARLGPGIGKKNMHAIETIGRQHLLQHLYYVMLDNAHIR